MRSATRSSFFALACLGSLASCGSGADDGNLLIKLSGLPDRVTTLSVTATLDDKTAMNAQSVTPTNGQFGVVLDGLTGHLVLSIKATDADGCVQAFGTGDTTLTGKYSELPITLMTQSPRMCGNLGCAAGTLCAYSPKPVATTLWGIWANSATDMWAVGDGGTALHYDGMAWTAAIVPVSADLLGIWGSSTKDVWAVGRTGTIVHYNGQSWAYSSSGAAYDLNGVYGINATDVWAVGSSSTPTTVGEFWHWDGTSLWKKVSTGIPGSLFSVWASAANDITASGASGLIIHYNGAFWSSSVPVPSSDLYNLWGSSPNLLFAAGSLGTIVRNDGTGWKKIPIIGYNANLYGVAGDKTGSAVYGVGNANASGNSVKAAAPFGNFSVQNFGNSDLTSLVVGSNGIVWVAGKLGYLGYFDTRP